MNQSRKTNQSLKHSHKLPRKEHSFTQFTQINLCKVHIQIHLYKQMQIHKHRHENSFPEIFLIGVCMLKNFCNDLKTKVDNITEWLRQNKLSWNTDKTALPSVVTTDNLIVSLSIRGMDEWRTSLKGSKS